MLLSFIFDIPIFLPFLGMFLLWLSRAPVNRFKVGWILVAGAFAVVAGFCLFFRQNLLLALLLAAFLASRLLERFSKNFLWTFGTFTLAVFWIVSGGLYFDLWGEGGNHFMWYSWLDRLGVLKTGLIPTPTYKEPFGFWNLSGFVLFASYPFILVWGGRGALRFFRWKKGILFGHVKGQTGLWGLLTNR